MDMKWVEAFDRTGELLDFIHSFIRGEEEEGITRPFISLLGVSCMGFIQRDS
jgi:hypothetical protein